MVYQLNLKFIIHKRVIKKLLSIILISLVAVAGAKGQSAADSTLLLPKQDLQWWRDAKFGLFIHYGIYSIFGKGEWVQITQPVEDIEYEKLKDKFTCEKFSGKQWVEAAKNAGCKYMVVTARHHDGFSLFDTKIGDYNSVNSPAKKDLMAEYAKAAHEANMKLGFYYSPLDWRYPGFFFPYLYRRNAEELKKQTYTQVRELLTNYGPVDVLWFDGGSDNWLGFGGVSYNLDGIKWETRGIDKPYTGKFSWEPLKLNKMVRELQPKIVINPRSGWMGDFQTQEVDLKGKINDRPWELCTTLGGCWGWVPETAKYTMKLDSLIRLLVTVVCQDGNLLLNVGPKPDGEIEPLQVQRLKEVGDYLSKFGESIYSTRGGIFDVKWGGTTTTDKAIYVHLLKVPIDGNLSLAPSAKKIISATCLNDHSKVKFVQSAADIKLSKLVNKAE